MSSSSNLVNQSKLPQLIDIVFNGVNPTVRGEEQIEKIVDYLIKNPGTAISLTGAATPQGFVKNNQKLAAERARRVKKLIESKLSQQDYSASNRVVIRDKNNLQASRSSVEVGTKVEIRSDNGKAAVSFFPPGSWGKQRRDQIQSHLNLISTAKDHGKDMSDQQRRKLLNNLALRLVAEGYGNVLFGGYDQNLQEKRSSMPGPTLSM